MQDLQFRLNEGFSFEDWCQLKSLSLWESKGPPKSKKAQEEAQEKPGGSNVGEKRETSGAKEGPFCGPSGGAPAGSYPVTNKKQWKSAKSYSRHAPKPGGIKACADRVAKKRGWKDKDYFRRDNYA